MKHERRARWTGVAVVLAAAVAAILPLLLRGTSCGHDFDFHLASWLDAHESWRQGIVYPHWAALANYGAGEPRFMFYPPLEWMLGAALGFVLPWKLVEPALVFMCLAACGLAARALARERLTDGAATLAGCVALFGGYELFNAYERSDFAELMGGFWIPLLLLYALRDRRPGERALRRALDGSTAPLALALAGAWLSNAPLGVMSSYLLAAVAMLLAVARKSWAPVLRAAAATAAGLALTGSWMIPAAVEQRWADMSQVLSDVGYRIESNWMFARHADPSMLFHDTELERASLVGTAMLLLALGSALLAWWCGRLREGRQWWIAIAAIPVLVLFLQLPVSGWVWNALPKMRFLQFPWRWLVTVQAPMGVLAGAALWTDRRRPRAVLLAASVAVFAVAVVIAGRLMFYVCDEEDAVWAMVYAQQTGEGWGGTYEYQPAGADTDLLAMDLPDACLTAEATKPLGAVNEDQQLQWTPEQKSCLAYYDRAAESRNEHFVLEADAARAGFLVLKLRSYPAWAVRVNGVPQTRLMKREDGLIVVPVAAGHARVTADWTATPDVWAGRGLTALGVLMLTGVCALEWRRGRPRVSL